MKVGDSSKSSNLTALYFDIDDHQWPIIYRPEYDVRFWGLEMLHPFDAHKWGKVANYLVWGGMLAEDMLVQPNEATKEDLLKVHTKRYIKKLKWSYNVALISEIAGLILVPNAIVQKKYLKPMRYQVGGSVLAGKLALERGYAINIGGGFHHCSSDYGGGFCPYADITLLIEYLRQYYNIDKVMIIDLDAHQGNGYEHDFLTNPHIYIMDMYNASIYPNDVTAKKAIRMKVELQSHTEDSYYLALLQKHLDAALNEFQPKIVIYNAGTDILRGDPYGSMSITPKGIIRRDELVFRKIRGLNIPIVMLTSGGYLPETAFIISESIFNLKLIGVIGRKGIYRTVMGCDT